MRLLFVTDGRSATSQNWIRHFVERGDEVQIGRQVQPAREAHPLVSQRGWGGYFF